MANFTLDQTGQEIQDILDTVGNNQATQGQVLTADGNGGASWQNASGGKVYMHYFTFSSNYHSYIFTTNPTTFTQQTLIDLLSTNNIHLLVNDSYGANNNLGIFKDISAQVGASRFLIYYTQYSFSSNGTNISINTLSTSENTNLVSDLVVEL